MGAVVGTNGHGVQILLGSQHFAVVAVDAGVLDAVLLGESSGLAGDQVGQSDDLNVGLGQIAVGMGFGDPAAADDGDLELAAVFAFFFDGLSEVGQNSIAHDDALLYI